MNSSTLIKDDGCLQLGIGSLSDALVYSLILRHKNNAGYVELLRKLNIEDKVRTTIENVGGTASFEKGLFGSTEMLVDGFLDLYKNDILKKRVYDDVVLQTLLNGNHITEEVTYRTVELLISQKRISKKITENDFNYLQYFGIFKDDEDLYYREGYIYFTEKNKIIADLNNVEAKKMILKKCLGKQLKNGRIVHAGFFIGSQKLYEVLNGLSTMKKNALTCEALRRLISFIIPKK